MSIIDEGCQCTQRLMNRRGRHAECTQYASVGREPALSNLHQPLIAAELLGTAVACGGRREDVGFSTL